MHFTVNLITRIVQSLISVSLAQVSLLYPQPGWAEIDPEELWKGFVTVVKGAVQGQTYPMLAYSVSICIETFESKITTKL